VIINKLTKYRDTNEETFVTYSIKLIKFVRIWGSIPLLKEIEIVLRDDMNNGIFMYIDDELIGIGGQVFPPAYRTVLTFFLEYIFGKPLSNLSTFGFEVYSDIFYHHNCNGKKIDFALHNIKNLHDSILPAMKEVCTRNMGKLKLYVWQGGGVLENYSTGLVCVLAKNEEEAWELLKGKELTVWYSLEGSIFDRAKINPVEYTEPCAFACWGSA